MNLIFYRNHITKRIYFIMKSLFLVLQILFMSRFIYFFADI